MRRKNRSVTLQWEGFSGLLGANGISFLWVNQSIPNLPPFPVDIPIRTVVCGKGRVGFFRLDPFSPSPLKMYLDVNDCRLFKCDSAIYIPGGSITWICV